MKKTANLTLCAMMVALASAFMLAAYFPYLTISIPAFAGLFIMVLVIETNRKLALLAYFASSVIVFLTCEPEAKMLYVLFFGYYPIVKSLFESFNNKVLEYVLKFVVFNASVVLAYFLLAVLFSFRFDDFGNFGKFTAVFVLLLGNAVFAVYDIAVSRVAQFYIYKIHPNVIKVLKGK